MVLGGLGHWWVVMLDRRAILASVKVVCVVLGGLGHWWVVMLDRRAFWPLYVNVTLSVSNNHGRFDCLSVCLSICLSVGLSVYTSVCLLVCQSVGLSVQIHEFCSFEIHFCLSMFYTLSIYHGL